MAAFDTAIGRAPSVRLLAALFALSLKWPPVLQMQKGAGVVLAPNARFRNTARLPVFEDTETLFEGVSHSVVCAIHAASTHMLYHAVGCSRVHNALLKTSAPPH